ncbi:MAG: XdhC family protein [Pyrinomonadaceae bacterium]|nr:XdhC family protein [Pyrinomonadaceae bacterium]
MKKDLEIWQFAAERLKKNQSVMLLVVAESSGSSPGRQGFKMIVAADELIGSVGGGVMEVALVEKARFQISNSKFQTYSEIVEQVHQKKSPDSSGMICSGKQTVIFFKLTPEHYKLIRKIPVYLSKPRGRYLRITQDSLILTGKKIPPFDVKFERESETQFLYEEKLGCKNKLFIIGGGHCALALSELMSKMDFHIALFDDRADLNTLAKNKFADTKTFIESYEKIGEFITSGANVYVVVMTLGYKSDEIVIRQLLDKNFKYFGVLGSRAKMKTLLLKLENEGVAKEKLELIRTPVGLPINSRTPEEIAVSIAAEIIAVKNNRSYAVGK